LIVHWPEEAGVPRAKESEPMNSRTERPTKRFCLTLDLKDDPRLIAEYKRYHKRVWPEIANSLREAGVVDMEIYLFGARMFMIMEVNEGFSFAKKAKMDLANPKVREWEDLMGKFQNPLPNASPVERWQVMERVFELEK
jgi:L-rhamnose mutarotase